ncbi:MAG: tripartite tricarboxylate transporter TctB family protein [Chloroflexi bacterium]|nr:tripartite tricarboxylate transporter TctB family protein [Chloroflexota bacterium]
MPQIRRALKDVLAGAVFIALGVAFAAGSLAYDIGTPVRMGPGYVPLSLGILLAALGILVIVKGFISDEGELIGEVDWRAVVLITAALLFFGLTVRGLGVVGALIGAALLATLARSQTSPREALVITAGITALSVVIFILALQLRLPLVGPWIPI